MGVNSIRRGLRTSAEARVATMTRILDQLDVEERDDLRADLIDDALFLSDVCSICAEMWRDYR